MFHATFGGFGGLETYEVDFEVYIGNQVVNRQRMQAPKEILMMNFMQTTEQIGRDTRPMKIKMMRQEVIWDNFENKERVLNNEIEFSNNAMVAFEKDKEEHEQI